MTASESRRGMNDFDPNKKKKKTGEEFVLGLRSGQANLRPKDGRCIMPVMSRI